VGSYTILGVSDVGLQLIREGNVPSALLKEFLGDIDTTGATTAKSLQPLVFPTELIQGVNPKTARIAILSTLRGFHDPVIKQFLNDRRNR
jgi:hypothetical protein